MKIINYVSTISIPLIIATVVLVGVREKKKVYDIFVEGVRDGTKIVVNLFPTLLAIFIAVGMLRNSGILESFINITSFLTEALNFPKEIVPLAILRPISGSASMAVAVDIMKNYGVDSRIGLIASTIMGSTETTFYTIAVYTSAVKIKKTRFVLFAALMADFVGIATSIIVLNIIE